MWQNVSSGNTAVDTVYNDVERELVAISERRLSFHEGEFCHFLGLNYFRDCGFYDGQRRVSLFSACSLSLTIPPYLARFCVCVCATMSYSVPPSSLLHLCTCTRQPFLDLCIFAATSGMS